MMLSPRYADAAATITPPPLLDDTPPILLRFHACRHDAYSMDILFRAAAFATPYMPPMRLLMS